MRPLKVSELTSLNPPVAGDAQIEHWQMLMFGLGVANNPQPIPQPPPPPSTTPTHHCCTTTITTDHDHLQPLLAPATPQHHQNDTETPHHQPQQENWHPPHQCNATTMVMMHDVITIHGGFPPGEPNTTPPLHFPIHPESRCHVADSNVATK